MKRIKTTYLPDNYFWFGNREGNGEMYYHLFDREEYNGEDAIDLSQYKTLNERLNHGFFWVGTLDKVGFLAFNSVGPNASRQTSFNFDPKLPLKERMQLAELEYLKIIL